MALNIKDPSVHQAVKQIAKITVGSGGGGRSERASGPDCAATIAARLLAGQQTASRMSQVPAPRPRCSAV